MREKWPELAQRGKVALGKYGYALLILALGAVLMLLPRPGEGRKSVQPDQLDQAEPFDLDAFEGKLEKILSQVEGAGQVRLVLTLDSGSRQILAQDQQREGAGVGSSTVVTVGPRRWSPSRPSPPASAGRWWSVPGAGIPRSACT